MGIMGHSLMYQCHHGSIIITNVVSITYLTQALRLACNGKKYHFSSFHLIMVNLVLEKIRMKYSGCSCCRLVKTVINPTQILV